MKIRFLFAVAFALISCASVLAQKAELSTDDLKVLEGSEWVGTLTYKDYSSGKPTSIKSNVLFIRDKDRSWTAEYKYPDEPKANSKANVMLSEDGTVFNDQKVVEKNRDGGVLKLITTKEGTDNDKKAVFRFTYTISDKQFSIRKEVKVEGSTEYFERNTYTWSR